MALQNPFSGAAALQTMSQMAQYNPLANAGQRLGDIAQLNARDELAGLMQNNGGKADYSMSPTAMLATPEAQKMFTGQQSLMQGDTRNDLTRRGQDMSAATARRGQDLRDSRSKDMLKSSYFTAANSMVKQAESSLAAEQQRVNDHNAMYPNNPISIDPRIKGAYDQALNVQGGAFGNLDNIFAPQIEAATGAVTAPSGPAAELVAPQNAVTNQVVGQPTAQLQSEVQPDPSHQLFTPSHLIDPDTVKFEQGGKGRDNLFGGAETALHYPMTTEKAAQVTKQMKEHGFTDPRQLRQQGENETHSLQAISAHMNDPENFSEEQLIEYLGNLPDPMDMSNIAPVVTNVDPSSGQKENFAYGLGFDPEMNKIGQPVIRDGRAYGNITIGGKPAVDLLNEYSKYMPGNRNYGVPTQRDQDRVENLDDYSKGRDKSFQTKATISIQNNPNTAERLVDNGVNTDIDKKLIKEDAQLSSAVTKDLHELATDDLTSGINPGETLGKINNIINSLDKKDPNRVKLEALKESFSLGYQSEEKIQAKMDEFIQSKNPDGLAGGGFDEDTVKGIFTDLADTLSQGDNAIDQPMIRWIDHKTLGRPEVYRAMASAWQATYDTSFTYEKLYNKLRDSSEVKQGGYKNIQTVPLSKFSSFIRNTQKAYGKGTAGTSALDQLGKNSSEYKYQKEQLEKAKKGQISLDKDYPGVHPWRKNKEALFDTAIKDATDYINELTMSPRDYEAYKRNK